MSSLDDNHGAEQMALLTQLLLMAVIGQNKCLYLQNLFRWQSHGGTNVFTNMSSLDGRHRAEQMALFTQLFLMAFT